MVVAGSGIGYMYLKWLYRINRPMSFAGRLESVAVDSWHLALLCGDPFAILEGKSR